MSRSKFDQIRSVHSFASNGIEFAVDGLVALGAVTAITGDAGVDKSTLIAALADHVSRGQPFCGRECKPRPVLLFYRENTLEMVKERCIRLGIYGDGIGCALKICGPWLGREAPRPDDSDSQAWVTSCDPKPLVIVDPLVDFREGDENDWATVRALPPLRELANRGAAVIVLCRSDNWDPFLDSRESLDFNDLIDVGFVLTNTGDMSLGQGQLRMKAFKSCFTVDSAVIFNYADGSFTSDDCAARTGDGCAPDPTNSTDELSTLLKDNPRITDGKFEKLAHARGLDRNRARNFLVEGAKAGRIRREKRGSTTMNTYMDYQKVKLF